MLPLRFLHNKRSLSTLHACVHACIQTRPVIEYYEAQSKDAKGKGIRVARIPGQLERDEVFGRIKAAVDPLIEAEVLALTERLLRAIAEGDWNTYEELCAADMTCFEPEARGHLVEGLVRASVFLNL